MKSALDLSFDPLAQYGVAQRYDRYVAEDHETWQRALQSLVATLESRCAVPYAAALQACGLNSCRLPRLVEINQGIGRYGWNAVMVDSFIPPTVFMSFQASKTLPITRQVRAMNQLLYTPIPDIIHEAAGHLPMLVDSQYRAFMQRFGEIGEGMRFSTLDERVYTAQKDFAEYAAQEQADQATLSAMQVELESLRKTQAKALTPACLVSRFHWWTVEFGLIGPDALLYGAGLLSSAGEAISSDKTSKRRLSLDCLDFDYEISQMQPQLFVADDWAHLNDELERLQAHIR